MRIRRIELNGFKSFMDPTAIDLPTGVTAIVGPNGCGKSNIVDAIRWVLGEQSPKHLRGTAMEDVIFAGNAQHGPLGMAEVSLLLERSEEDLLQALEDEAAGVASDGSGLPPELAHATEVLVSRRYFRSGESEYFINRAPCRLRDITELFLGTGVGTKAYAIIEQGRVEQLVSAKPADLRLFIEEAAGTTRFRARRLSAERKMTRTRENLLRVQDVLHEQARQIASLERQAKRAEEHRRLKGELRDLDLRLAAAQYRTLLTRRLVLATRLGVLRSEMGAIDGRLRLITSASGRARVQRDEAEAKLREVEDGHTAAQIAAAEAEARRESLRTRRRDLERLEERYVGERAALESRHAEAVRVQAAANAALESARAEASAAAEAERAAGTQVQEVLARGQRLESALEEAKDALVGAVGEEARLANMAQALAERRNALEGQRQQLEEEHRVLGDRLETNQRAREHAVQTLEDLARRRRSLESDVAKLEQQRTQAVIEATEHGAALEALRRDLTQLESRAESLRDMHARAEGCTRGAASLLTDGSGERILLADILRVPAPLERAVAVALRARLSDVVVDSSPDAVEAVRWLISGGGGTATALPVDPERRVATIVPAGRRLLEEVEVEPRYWALAEALLGNVLLADDLDQARSTWRDATHSVTVVTRAGEAIDHLGAVTGGSEPPLHETLLARGRELRDLEAEILTQTEVVERRAAAARVGQETVGRLDGELAEVTERRQQQRLEQVAAEKDRDRLDEERARLTAELEVSALEVSGVLGAGGEVADELRGLEDSRLRATQLAQTRRAAVEAAQAALADWRTECAAVEQERTDSAIERAALGERVRALETADRAARDGVDDVHGRLTSLEEALAAARSEQVAVDEDVQRVQAEGAAAAERVDVLGTSRETLRATIAGLSTDLQSEDAQERLLREYREGGRSEQGAAEVQLTEAKLEVEHIAERLRERWDVGLEAITDDTIVSTPVQPEEQERADGIRSRLVRLGDINPSAIEELDEVRERHDFVDGQRRDLEKSLADLEHTIATLNKTCRERFRETFEAANAMLGVVFPKLFPGGHARLEKVQLADEEGGEEGGEGGIEIVVQPAGKKLQSLNLLSGGEKALTATALVFSLFLIRPTPFCLLDEVDAPLDEANIGRFNQMVREMAESSQFVVVTHNRRTMEGADTLYGITMEQPGVSKVVSVRLNEAA